MRTISLIARRRSQPIEVPGHFRWLFLAIIGFVLLMLPRHGEERHD